MHDMIDQYKAALIAHVTSASGSQIKELNSKLMAQKVQLQKKVNLFNILCDLMTLSLTLFDLL